MKDQRVPGEAKEVRLDGGVVRYREEGDGEPIVFLHGIFVHGGLWRKVVEELAEDFRCVVPDLPLGGHDAPMDPGADLSSPGLTKMVADFLAALDLDRATLVGNDTGGAIAQMLVANHPERVGRLVLTPCDAYENFLPPALRYLQWASRVPGSAFLVGQVLRVPPLRRLAIAFGWLSKRPVERGVMDSYVEPLARSRGVRRDLEKVLRGISPRHTLRAAERFGAFARPVLIAWAREDRLFPFRHAERLARAFPEARLEAFEDSYSYVPEDQPKRLADLIGSFIGSQ